MTSIEMLKLLYFFIHYIICIKTDFKSFAILYYI